jgi:hypothetical protein
MEPITRANAIWKALVANPLVGIVAIVTIIVGLFTITEKLGKGIVSGWQAIHACIGRRRGNRIVDFLAAQTNPEPRSPNARGHTPPTHLSCGSVQIAEALNLKPLPVLHLLGRLKEQRRVEQQGIIDSWKVSKHELDNRNWRKRK